MLDILEGREGVFASLSGSQVTDEDMNPYNLARLKLWRLTRGPALRDGYTEIADIPAEYVVRRPILQLLWCLEYADDHTSAAHADTQRAPSSASPGSASRDATA